MFIASVLIFYAIHAFARPLPRTMSKEWQEATNEYAKVCIFRFIDIYFAIGFNSCSRISDGIMESWLTDNHRPSVPTPSTVSTARATRARASSRAHLARNNREIASYFVLVKKIFAEVQCVS